MDILSLFEELPPAKPRASSPIMDNTPIEKVAGWENLWVKREDLCSPHPGPSFSKIRGVYSHISKRPENLIGVLDTYHSKAGWAVSYVCSLLGKQCLDFYPRYQADPEGVLRYPQEMAVAHGAELFPLKAGRSSILFHSAKRETLRRGGYLMPNALKLPETVDENQAEVVRTSGMQEYDHVVLSISSATIATGVLKGIASLGLNPQIWLHMGYDRSEEEIRRYMAKYQPLGYTFNISFINERYGYKDEARVGAWPAPSFPCNPYYDLKAWRWLVTEGLAQMQGRVLFWNIGS